MVEFGVLGSVEARVDGRLMDLGHAKQRLLLAILLVNVGREVSIDELAERIWGEERARRGTLYAYLSKLRRVLAAVEGVKIERRPAGYVLAADPASVDLYRFRELVAWARETGDDKRAAELFGKARDLWRGQALAGADTAWANTVREGLHQERLNAELDGGEVLLRLGRYTELVGRLWELAAEYPEDEGLAGQLILALHRSGCTAEALGHYQEIRRSLAERLDVAPGPELRRLHQQILTGTSSPAWKTGTVADGSAPAAAAPGGWSVPRHLPIPPALFTGREDELARLSAVQEEEGGRSGTEGTMVISAISGSGGVGKTHLVLRWAHEQVERFPDGQLYVDLRGFDPVVEPLATSAVLRGFLGALGVATAAIPAEPHAQAALYRSLVAGRRMLVVLDNARDTAQVVPLLPGSPSCTVLVTSRLQLAGLITTYAAKPLVLNMLPPTDARRLLARHLGEDRLAAEPEAAAALLEHCAGLPLALGIIAARAATQPDLSLAYLAQELAEAETRLDALDTGELAASLRAVFSSSHRTLPPEAARAFALLGLTPGPDISLHTAASLTATTASRARALLRTLENAHLVQQYTPGRYRIHDLVHLYAAEHGHALDKQEREATLRRLVDHYLHTAHHAALLLEPHPLVTVDLAPPADGCAPHRPTDQQAALAWYETERPCLLAVQKLAQGLGWHTPVWQVPHVLFAFHLHQDRFCDALEMWRIALDAAGQLPDPRPEAVVHCHLGYFHARLDPPKALEHLDQALAVFGRTGDLPGQAFTHFGFCVALTWLSEGRDLQRGLHHVERAGQLFRSLGNPAGECYALSLAGWCHARLGEHQEARACCEQALTIARATDSPNSQAYALDKLGFVLHQGGRYAEALTYHHQAVVLYRGFGCAYWEAVALYQLGRSHRALGQVTEARHAGQRAHDLFRVRRYVEEAERVQRWMDALGDAVAGD